MFDLEINGFEVIARSLIIYLALLIALRLAGKRELGQMTPFDLIVLLLISEAVQNAIISKETSVTGGLIAAGALIGANYGLAGASERIDWLRHALEGTPTVLIRDGRLLKENLARENLEEEELLMAVRQHGIEKVEDVRLAVLETDGSISIIPAEGKPQGRRRSRLFRKR